MVIAIIFNLASLSVSGQVRQQPLDKVARGAELFEAGQNAHERGDLEKAVGLYGDAFKDGRDVVAGRVSACAGVDDDEANG